MIFTEKQAKRELLRRDLEERRRVIDDAVEAFADYRELAAREAWIYEADAEAEEVTLGVLRARLMVRFWRFFERRHEENIEWVRSLEANERGGN